MPTIRARYKAQRDAMHAALERHLPAWPACRWTVPRGGMFFWVELPRGVDAMALLPQAVERGVAFVPGAAFYADAPRAEHAAPVVRDRRRPSASSAASRRWPPLARAARTPRRCANGASARACA